jgi:hypothetical protein
VQRREKSSESGKREALGNGESGIPYCTLQPMQFETCHMEYGRRVRTLTLSGILHAFAYHFRRTLGFGGTLQHDDCTSRRNGTGIAEMNNLTGSNSNYLCGNINDVPIPSHDASRIPYLLKQVFRSVDSLPTGLGLE